MNIQYTEIRDNLTIIIPAKNEGETLWECVQFLCNQSGVKGTSVIIADCSDSTDSFGWIKKIQKDFKEILDIDVIPGGFPAAARLSGSKLATTQMILFLDADIMLKNKDTLIYALQSDKDLITLTMETERGWNWVYRSFDFFQKLSNLLGTPFAVGGFQLWKTDAYWKCGGYNPDDLFAEDYALSKKVSKHEFGVLHKPRVWTSARRFKQKGVKWMFTVMIKSYLNRNNPNFFKQHHGYWD